MSEYQKITQSVSFVVLALNEQKVVEQVVREIHSTVDALINTYEIILINDGSTDRTGEIMEMLSRELTNTRVLHSATALLTTPKKSADRISPSLGTSTSGKRIEANSSPR